MAKDSYDLVVLAAGMGSRFGGLKQVQPVGPHGELIIEYSAYDARRAGFDRLVLVIRRDIERDFREAIGRRLEKHFNVEYVFQEISDIPSGMNLSGGQVPPRSKPWGTGHAVLAARKAVRRPFAVINADDFYGAAGYRALADYFTKLVPSRDPAVLHGFTSSALVGYPLRQSLSEHGAVSRGLCSTDAAGRLLKITEVTKIEKTATGARYTTATGATQLLSGDEIVSMNFWGFRPSVFNSLEQLFTDFISKNSHDPKAEFYLPTALSQLNENGAASISLLRSEDAWFGITYREDLPAAQQAVGALIKAGRYPAPLWG